MRAIDFLIEKYFNKARVHVEDLSGKGKTLIKFRQFFYEVGEYYGNTRLSSARAALETARKGRFLGSVDRAVLIPLLGEILKYCEMAADEGKTPNAKAEVAYGSRTVDLSGELTEVQLAVYIIKGETPKWDRLCYRITDTSGKLIDAECR